MPYSIRIRSAKLKIDIKVINPLFLYLLTYKASILSIL